MLASSCVVKLSATRNWKLFGWDVFAAKGRFTGKQALDYELLEKIILPSILSRSAYHFRAEFGLLRD